MMVVRKKRAGKKKVAKKKATRKAVRKRGSALLMDRGMTLSEKQLGQLVDISKIRGVKLVDWCIYGQPAPDRVCGTFQVPPRLADNVIRALIKVKGIPLGIDVFPLGTPVLDNVLISFRNRSRFLGGVTTEG